MIIDFRPFGSEEIYIDGLMIITKDFPKNMFEIRLPDGEHRRLKFKDKTEMDKFLAKLMGK